MFRRLYFTISIRIVQVQMIFNVRILALNFNSCYSLGLDLSSLGFGMPRWLGHMCVFSPLSHLTPLEYYCYVHPSHVALVSPLPRMPLLTALSHPLDCNLQRPDWVVTCVSHFHLRLSHVDEFVLHLLLDLGTEKICHARYTHNRGPLLRSPSRTSAIKFMGVVGNPSWKRAFSIWILRLCQRIAIKFNSCECFTICSCKHHSFTYQGCVIENVTHTH